MPFTSQPISDKRVYAQDTTPTDTREGIIWIDTSVSPRRQYVYSTDSEMWESVLPENTSPMSSGGGYVTEYDTINNGNTNYPYDIEQSWSINEEVVDGFRITTNYGSNEVDFTTEMRATPRNESMESIGYYNWTNSGDGTTEVVEFTKEAKILTSISVNVSHKMTNGITGMRLETHQPAVGRHTHSL